MMTAKWLYNGKAGRALMGEVVNISKPTSNCKPAYRLSQTFIEVRVTSYESKKDKNKVGKMFLVTRNKCQLEV